VGSEVDVLFGVQKSTAIKEFEETAWRQQFMLIFCTCVGLLILLFAVRGLVCGCQGNAYRDFSAFCSEPTLEWVESEATQPKKKKKTARTTKSAGISHLLDLPPVQPKRK
jgi:hypothetical protein